MQITKRDGRVEPFDIRKIENAIKASLVSTGKDFPETLPAVLAESVAASLSPDRTWSVEEIQDAAEKTLMAAGEFDAAKNYILFRSRRTELRKERKRILDAFDDKSIEDVLISIQNDFPDEQYSLSILADKFLSFSKNGMGENEEESALVRAAVELTGPQSPSWEFIAARFLLHSFRRALNERMKARNIVTFSDKLSYLVSENLYGSYITEGYTKAELDEAYSFIDDSRDNLFTYSGLDLLLKRYVIHSHQHEPLETPQEMFLGIALHLALPEKRNRMGWVRKFYDMLSKMEVTMATPTLANSRKPIHQLSSCFIDTVPDSLDGIYRSLDNFAKVSKFGGGMGMYFGKVRANGSSIRGFEGAAGGVIRWIRLVNDTAVAVDQLKQAITLMTPASLDKNAIFRPSNASLTGSGFVGTSIMSIRLSNILAIFLACLRSSWLWLSAGIMAIFSTGLTNLARDKTISL